tara:strand:+ start:103 stop:861 length:759 start_codon:yes stop_codon:yes gene_type:complete
MSRLKKYKNRKERLEAKKRYYEKNKHWLNANRREKRKLNKKPKSKFKNCTSCGKRLEKIEKNFRYKSKKKGVFTFRPVCRPCERKQVSEYSKSPVGKTMKKKAGKKYKASEKGKAADKRYYNKNKTELMRKSVAKRAIQRKINPHVKIRDNLSLRMRLALKEQNLTKRNTTNELVGCSIKFLKRYLEKQFYPHPSTGEMMTWKNHTIKGWHIDHIKPCSSFDLSVLKQQKRCFNYRNLQPLWAKENIIKSNK